MDISPDSTIFWQWGFIKLSATLVFTWAVMILLVIISWLATRKIAVEPPISRWQHFLEIVIGYLRDQIRDVTNQEPDRYLSFLGTLFLFIALSNILAIIPFYQPPTGSLYTTSALAICVFFAVPIFGVAYQGVGKYLKRYIQPSIFMLPFNIIGELSRTLALAVRLFGNVMSGSLVAGLLVSVAPLFLPALMSGFGLLIGVIQAYIFFILATVYIGSATRGAEKEGSDKSDKKENSDKNGKENNKE